MKLFIIFLKIFVQNKVIYTKNEKVSEVKTKKKWKMNGLKVGFKRTGFFQNKFLDYILAQNQGMI